MINNKWVSQLTLLVRKMDWPLQITYSQNFILNVQLTKYCTVIVSKYNIFSVATTN